MTDITELSQSLKAAAEKATPGEWRRASTQFNGITATPFMLGRKEVMIACASKKCDAEFIALANPVNVRALVEALESAEAKSASELVFFIEIEGDDWINAGRIPGSKFDFNNLPDGVNKLYAAPQPAPVVAEDFESAWERMRDDRYVHNRAWAEKFWNACRAAMLLENPKSAGESNNCRRSEKVQDLLAGNCRENGNSSTNNFRENAETSTNRSREHFISLCNEFWNWSEMDLVCSDDRGYELRMEWDGKVFKHPVTQALWRMYQAAPTGIPMIPDGYVMVPIDLLSDLRDWAHPEIEKYCEMWKGRRDSEFPALRKVIADADAMLAAAPQEVKP